MVITGYRLNGTDIGNAYQTLNKVKEKLKTIANREYHRLLGKEVAFIVDHITINAIQRDENVRIIDSALQNLNQRISIAEGQNIECEYNLKLFTHILSDAEYTYFNVICPNKKLLGAFKGVEDYSLNEVEFEDKQNAKTKKWMELEARYSMMTPAAVMLSQGIIEYKKDQIKYPTIKERAETVSRHGILNRILSQISNGEQIHPLRVMDYMEEAVNIYSESLTLKNEYADNVTKALQTFVDLEKHPEIVFLLPGEEVAED